ncbi:hypothetical protein BC828DRAFT_388943 [Blastocladiella britannica]|nr:hypothetical protein BC828DRAFT_388943 [Blastocladiella britannica]
MHQQLATQLLRYTSVFVVFVTLVSLYSSISLHTVELVEGQDGAVFRTTTNAKVLWFRDQDRFLQFATFLIIHLLNLVCDFLFIRAIVTSMQQTNQKVKLSKEDRNRMLLPYIPPSIITVFYVLASILVVTKAKIPALSPFIVTTSIALSRIAPVVETFAFYCFAVNHTRLLLKNMSRTGSNSQTGARSGVTTGVGYSGYIRSQVGVSSNPFISTSGGDKGTIRGVTKFSDAPMPLAPFTRPAPPAPVAHGYGSAGTSGTGASSSAYGTQATAWSSQQSQTYDAPTTQGAPGRKTSRGAVSSSSGTLSRPHY